MWEWIGFGLGDRSVGLSGYGTYRWKQDGLDSPSLICLDSLVHLSFLRTAEGTLFYLCLQNSLALSSNPALIQLRLKCQSSWLPIMDTYLSVSLQGDPDVSIISIPFPSPLC